MMRLTLCSLAVLVAGMAAAAQPQKRASMPLAFQGDWALENRDCAMGPSDSGNMRISARQISLFESVGNIVRVDTLDPRTLRVESRVAHGDGTSGSIEMMSLSSDKHQLAVGEHSDISVYKRCKK
jgi:hypothetical protein